MNVVDASMIFGGFGGGAAAVAVVTAPALRRGRRIEHGVTTIWRVVLGTPAQDGEPAQPGVMERLSAQDAELAQIKAKIGKIGEMEDTTRRRVQGGR